MKKLYTLVLVLTSFAGGLTAQVLPIQITADDSAPQLDSFIRNINVSITDEADTLDLSLHFSDPDSPEASLGYSVLSIQDEGVASATISGNDLILSYLGSGQTYIIVEATFNGLAITDTFAVGVMPQIESSGFTVATFEDLTLEDESFWEGSDESGKFSSGNVTFYNEYNPEWFSWTGWAYSNTSDNLTPGYFNQYSAYTGSGIDSANGSNYAISYHYLSTAVSFNDDKAHDVKGFFITNTTYAALSMKNGDDYTKKFGGSTGDDEDWFNLKVTGFNKETETGTVDFKLADFTNSDNALDYIIETWQWIDLSSLGAVDSLTFAMSSTDNGDFGMNTPSYFAMDNMYVSTFPSTIDSKHNEIDFLLYPNPSNGIFRIQTGYDSHSDIRIFDISGKSLLSIDDYTNGQKIDLSNMPSGIYLISVTNVNYTKQQTIIIR